MEKIKNRAKILILLFVVWGLIVCFYLIYFNFVKREAYLKSSRDFSLKEGVVPASRGSIYNYSGKKIAWSEIVYDIKLRRIIQDQEKEEVVDVIRKTLPKIDIVDYNKNNYFVAYGLTLNQTDKLIEVKNIDKFVEIKAVHKRFYSCTVKTKNKIGYAEFQEGIWIGLSGIEKKYNKNLNGKNGLFSIMVDKKGNWVKSTFKENVKAVPGTDLHLNRSSEVLNIID